MKDQLESFFWNKALPVIFKGLEWTLLGTLLYSFVLLMSNAFNELF